jgi:uncharacterized membrane protein YkvA (DUF1232 family)
MLTQLKTRARQIKSETFALYLAYHDPRTPLHAKIFAAGVVAYAFSPIDLIPDFIPVLGYVDDVILVPLGIVIAIKMIPPEVMDECRVRAHEEIKNGRPINKGAAVVIVLLWILSLALIVWVVWKMLKL